MLLVQPAAVAHHERGYPQPRRKTRFPYLVQHPFHSSGELGLYLQPIPHLRGETIINLKDIHGQLFSPGDISRALQMLQDVFFIDVGIQVVPGTPAGDSRGRQARRQGRGGGYHPGPLAQSLFHLVMVKDDQPFRLAALQTRPIFLVPQGFYR